MATPTELSLLSDSLVTLSLTQRVFQVVWQKSISTRIRRLVLDISNSE